MHYDYGVQLICLAAELECFSIQSSIRLLDMQKPAETQLRFLKRLIDPFDLFVLSAHMHEDN